MTWVSAKANAWRDTRFCKPYASLAPAIQDALRHYKTEVKNREFPEAKHTYAMDEGEDKLLEEWRVSLLKSE